MPDISPTGAELHLPGIEQLELIGRGGFAAVYRGWQPAFHRWVAVKFLTGSHGQSPAYRFDHETRALGSLSEHPHVVPVYAAGKVGGRPYLVMPFLTGGSLQHRMQAGPVPARQAVVTALAIADALAEAHRLGILHRDIKPGNILYNAYGVPQLADFGVARIADATFTGGFLAVTVSYAAPEVLSGQASSPLSDVYSLGATMYAALRGAPPFAGVDGEPPIAQAMRVVQEVPDPLEPVGVPAAVAAVIARAMAKDPAARYRSAAEFRDALATVIDAAEKRPAVAPEGVVGRIRSGRRRLVVATAAVAVLAGSGGAVGASFALGPAHAPDRAAAARDGAPRAAGSRPTQSGRPANRPSAVSAPSNPEPAAPPTTARASGSTAAGYQPPSAGGATNPNDVPAAVLADTLRSYYALVDQHRLDQSWTWLTPAFQDRVGLAYYHQFWDSITQVQVLSVQPSGGEARITLRYVASSGATSVESATLRFAVAGRHILIDTNPTAPG